MRSKNNKQVDIRRRDSQESQGRQRIQMNNKPKAISRELKESQGSQEAIKRRLESQGRSVSQENLGSLKPYMFQKVKVVNKSRSQLKSSSASVMSVRNYRIRSEMSVNLNMYMINLV